MSTSGAAPQSYREVVLDNAQTVSSVESSVRSLTYILPVYASIGLIGHYHDSILAREARRQLPHTPVSRFNRYTIALHRSSRLASTVSIALTVVQTFEVFCEMLAAKFGGKKIRSRTILTIETIKVVCRLLLLRLSGNRMLLHSQMPDREYDVTKMKPASAVPGTSWRGKRTGREHIPVISLAGSDESARAMQFLQARALTELSASPLQLVSRLTGLREIGEILFILRPLLYVLAIKKYGSRSYKPWVLSLLVELFSFGTAFNPHTRALKSSLTDLERDEVKRRAFLFLYYLLRNPFFGDYTKERLVAFSTSLSTKPVISFFSGVIQDYIPLWENYHFYTASGNRR
nr:Peroxisomal membrane protein pex16 [Polyrhizophydium stewartii]